jgi:predicted mannosyl-3-phosphoglycerate phosphatase (HAD superfamily)
MSYRPALIHGGAIAESINEREYFAAVIDFGLHDGEATALCRRLNERGISFILHSGYSHVCEHCRAAVVIPKLAKPNELVGTVVRLLHEDPGA